MVFAGVAANTTNFAPLVDQDEQRCKAFHCNETQIRRQWIIDIYSPQWRTLAFRSFCINRRNFAVKCLAPNTAGLFKHYKFRSECGCRAKNDDRRTQKRCCEKKIPEFVTTKPTLFSRANERRNERRGKPAKHSTKRLGIVSRSGNRANYRMNAVRSERGGGDRRRAY